MSEKNTAVLVVSFGTTHLDTLERCIQATEKAIGGQFPGCPVYRAFLSGIVMRCLQEKYGMHVDTVTEALEAIRRDGYSRVVIQPTLILGGIEYDLLKSKLSREQGLEIAVGRPLIMDQADCEAMASVIMEENPLDGDEALVLMGHGTEHKANEIYDMMQETFTGRGYRCFLGTVEGIPSFEDAVGLLAESGASRAKLLPLMFVAGDHAKNDMAGDEDSLRTMVEAENIQAVPIIRGLGESAAVQKLYAERARAAMEEMKWKE